MGIPPERWLEMERELEMSGALPPLPALSTLVSVLRTLYCVRTTERILHIA
jgi:hypothetical protein